MSTIHARSPVRICDTGGWTDTWFARHGRVFNIAVRPAVEVDIDVTPSSAGAPRLTIHADNFGDRYQPVRGPDGGWDRHPLLEAAVEYMRLPADRSLRITIFCEVPAGAGTGTSAAVAVALVGALDRVRGGVLTCHDIARAAHEVETDLLGQQSGVQDQLSAAYGGVNDILVTAYPQAEVRPLRLPAETLWELERRLSLVYLGAGHSSSAIHDLVIDRLAGLGPECAELAALRRAAEQSRDAVLAGDFAALGRAMHENTEAHRALHPAIVGADAERVIAIAREYGTAGWKVNGAGGEGGSLTLLSGPSSDAKRAMLRAITQASTRYRAIPIALSPDGLRVWETP